jgi:hypothetical protein
MAQQSIMSDEDRLYSAVPELVRRLRDDPSYANNANELDVPSARRRAIRVREVANEIADYWSIDFQLLVNTCASMIGDIRGINSREEARAAFLAEVLAERSENVRAIK